LEMITEVLPKLIEEDKAISPSTLYAKYTQLWLERDDWRAKLAASTREQFTIAFAESMYQLKAQRFTWKEIERAIAKRWPEATRRELEQYEQDIRCCSFLTWDNGNQVYRYVHESFLEYFVSVSLYSAIISAEVSPLSRTVYTRQVLDFLMSHPQTSEFSSSLHALLQQDSVANESVLDRSTRLSNILILHTLLKLPINNMSLADAEFAALKLPDAVINMIRLTRLRVTDGEIVRANVDNVKFISSHFERVKSIDIKASYVVIESHTSIDCVCSAISVTNCVIRTYRGTSIELADVKFLDGTLDDLIVSNSSFSDLDLVRTRITTSQFNDCIFRKLRMQDIVVNRAEMNRVNFDGVYLHNTTLDRARFVGCQFILSLANDAIIHSTVFHNSILVIRNANKLHFESCTFSGDTTIVLESGHAVSIEKCDFQTSSVLQVKKKKDEPFECSFYACNGMAATTKRNLSRQGIKFRRSPSPRLDDTDFKDEANK